MPIRVSCACGERFRVKDSQAGRRGKCPQCGGEVLIPFLEDLTAGPAGPPAPAAAPAEPRPDPGVRRVVLVGVHLPLEGWPSLLLRAALAVALASFGVGLALGLG